VYLKLPTLFNTNIKYISLLPKQVEISTKINFQEEDLNMIIYVEYKEIEENLISALNLFSNRNRKLYLLDIIELKMKVQGSSMTFIDFNHLINKDCKETIEYLNKHILNLSYEITSLKVGKK